MTEIPHGHAHTKTQPWVYALGVGIGALGLLYWFHSNKAAGSAVPATVDSSSGYPVLTSDPLGSSGGGSSGGSTVPDTAPQSNSAWEATAIAWLVTQGKNPLTAQTALEQYLAGNPLTSDQGALVSLVVGKYGLPPQGSAGPPIVAPAPTPPPTNPPPVPTPAPPPVHSPVKTPIPTAPRPVPTPHITTVPPPKPAPTLLATHTVVYGDTLSGLALRYYGHGTPYYYLKIAAYNGIPNPDHITVGQVIKIPR